MTFVVFLVLLPAAWGCFPYPEMFFLDCHHSGLSSVEQLPGIDWVKFLDVSENAIERVDVPTLLAIFPGLQSINATGNLIQNCADILQIIWITSDCKHIFYCRHFTT